MRLLTALLLLCAIAPAAAQSSKPYSYAWEYGITPYVWLPNVNGTLKFSAPGGGPEVEVGADKYLQNLDLALMFMAEARKGPWSFYTDVIYLDFSGVTAAVRNVTAPGGVVQAPVNAATQASLEGLVWELAASYALVRGTSISLDMLGGLRHLRLHTTVDWQLAGPIVLLPQSGNRSQKEELWDFIIGTRGEAGLGASRWFIPYHFDIGAGSSALTWQAVAGIGYSFKWGDVRLAYRHLYYEQKDDKLIQDIAFSGPALGAAFRF